MHVYVYAKTFPPVSAHFWAEARCGLRSGEEPSVAAEGCPPGRLPPPWERALAPPRPGTAGPLLEVSVFPGKHFVRNNTLITIRWIFLCLDAILLSPPVPPFTSPPTRLPRENIWVSGRFQFRKRSVVEIEVHLPVLHKKSKGFILYKVQQLLR